MEEGFYITKFFNGPHGRLSEYINVEANPAYERNAGIPKRGWVEVREMVPARPSHTNLTAG
jgi:hypothetical protein